MFAAPRVVYAAKTPSPERDMLSERDRVASPLGAMVPESPLTSMHVAGLQAATILVQETPRPVVKETPLRWTALPPELLGATGMGKLEEACTTKRLSFGKENSAPPPQPPANAVCAAPSGWAAVALPNSPQSPLRRANAAISHLGACSFRLRTAASHLSSESSEPSEISVVAPPVDVDVSPTDEEALSPELAVFAPRVKAVVFAKEVSPLAAAKEASPLSAAPRGPSASPMFADAETQPPSPPADDECGEECVADCCDCCDCSACRLQQGRQADDETQPPSPSLTAQTVTETATVGQRAAPSVATREAAPGTTADEGRGSSVNGPIGLMEGAEAMRTMMDVATSRGGDRGEVLGAASACEQAVGGATAGGEIAAGLATGDVAADGAAQEMLREVLQQHEERQAMVEAARVQQQRVLDEEVQAERFLAMQSEFAAQLQHRDAKIDVRHQPDPAQTSQ